MAIPKGASSAFQASRKHPAGEQRQDYATWFRDTGNAEAEDVELVRRVDEGDSLRWG